MSVHQEEIEQSATIWPWHFNPFDHRLSEEETRRAAKIAQKYLNENHKLFPREVLSKISIILRDHRKGRWREGVPFVELQDYVDGSNRPYSIKLDLGPDGNTLRRLNYVPVQPLMNPYWYERSNCTGGVSHEPLNPLQIVTRSYDIPEGENFSTGEFNVWWSEAVENWETAKPWRNIEMSIQQTFENIPNKNLPPINKIIAFEIGSVWRQYANNKPYEHRYEGVEDRVSQHALIRAIGVYLRQRTGNKVQTCVQDPTYTAEDLPFLQHLGLEQLEEPAGFTNFDQHTLVYSVNAGIPVMQIIADMERTPAMIFWREAVEHNTLFRADDYGGDYLAVKSDPISPRVELLLRNYRQYRFGEIGIFLFGDHTRLYVLQQGQDQHSVIDPVHR